jgi:hypothetical protein
MTKRNHWFPRKEKQLEEQKPIYVEVPIFDPPPKEPTEKREPTVIDLTGDDNPFEV